MGSYMRYANKEDAEAIALINSKSAQQGFKGVIPDSFLNQKFSYESLRERLSKELNEGTTTNCIMYYNEVAIGMTTFAEDDYIERDNSEIDIWRFYFLPEYWGKNLSLEFMNWSLEKLKGKGYAKAALWVLEENPRSRRFYEKAGFYHDGEVRIINPGREVKEMRYVKNI